MTQISGGEHHTLFLLSDGSVWGCGRCDGFELGLADDHPALKGVDERREAQEARWREKKASVLEKREKAEKRKRAGSVGAKSRASTEEPSQTEPATSQLANASRPGPAGIPSMISRTPSYNAQDEWASDKPPPMNEYVPEPVPICFPPTTFAQFARRRLPSHPIFRFGVHYRSSGPHHPDLCRYSTQSRADKRRIRLRLGILKSVCAGSWTRCRVCKSSY